MRFELNYKTPCSERYKALVVKPLGNDHLFNGQDKRATTYLAKLDSDAWEAYIAYQDCKG